MKELNYKKMIFRSNNKADYYSELQQKCCNWWTVSNFIILCACSIVIHIQILIYSCIIFLLLFSKFILEFSFAAIAIESLMELHTCEIRSNCGQQQKEVVSLLSTPFLTLYLFLIQIVASWKNFIEDDLLMYSIHNLIDGWQLLASIDRWFSGFADFIR
jgi:hypothetical protein